MFCSKCGESAVPEANFCVKCGGGLLSPPTQSQPEAMRVTDSSSAPTQVRPWVRFWARIFDVYVFTSVVFAAMLIVAPQLHAKLNEWVILIVLGFMWLFVESLLLSTVQTTPGKWLLKTKIALVSAAPISYAQALSRSLNVWLRGFGAGIPIVSIIAMIISNRRLITDGLTSWDRDGRFSVSHERIGIPRVLVTIVCAIVVSVLCSIAVPPECRSISSHDRLILEEKCRE